MSFITPTIDDFKAYFVRDFPYGADPTLNVLDIDISKALNEAAANFNPALFENQTVFSMAFLYLGAHYMIMDLRASSQGVSGQFNWLQASKAVGNVNEAFNIPQKILDNPMYSYYSKSNYGAKYLSLILPRLVGQIYAVAGRTHA